MKITTFIAAAALATASTAATAQNVTTSEGDLVIIEKNQGVLGLAPAATATVLVAAIIGGFVILGESSNSGGGS